MDTKRFILSMTAVLAMFLAWQMLIGYLDKQHPEWHMIPSATQPADTASSSTQPTTVAAGSTPATTAPTTAPAVAANANSSGGYTLAPVAPQPTRQLGSIDVHDDPQFHLGLMIDPVGVGLDSATLNQFYANTDKNPPPYQFQEPVDGLNQDSHSLASRELLINGKSLDLAAASWTPAPGQTNSPSDCTYVATILDQGKPVLEVQKSFHLPTSTDSDGSQGYEIGVVETFKNLSGQPLKLRSTLNGPTLPPRESDRSEDRGFVAGYDDEREVAETATPLTYFSSSHPSKDLVSVDNRPLLWAGAASAYFDAIVRPDYTGQTAKTAIRIAAVPITVVNADAPADDRTAVMALQSADFTVGPGSASTLNFKVFLGPKKRELLKNAYYSVYPRSYNTTLITTGGWCGFLTFAPLINLLYGILWFFHLIFRDWGIAIICLVVLVRVLLHPITRRSQVNMMRMTKMGPELERLKKKFGEDKDAQSKAMMEFYKEQGMAPVLGCLPMFLQTPIWIALWSALQSTFDLRQAPFLRFGWLHLTWIKDLSHPDALITFHTPIPLPFGWHLQAINVLPILLAVVFFGQQKVMPQPVATSPEQEQQRKLMQWLMPLMFPLMLYAGPSGLNLYILTSTTIGIFESKIIRDHIKQREEAEKAGRIIVPTKATRAARRRDGKEAPQAPKNIIARILTDLQAKAEQIRREAERRGR